MKSNTLATVLGVCIGGLFTFVVGYIDPANYLIELMSIWIVEVPVIIATAVLIRKYGIGSGALFIGAALLVSFVMTFGESTITAAVLLKDLITGLLLGEMRFGRRGTAQRLLTISAPGLLLAAILGIPLVLQGVSPDIMDRVRQDTLEMYQAFMSNEEALNTTDNAMEIFRGMFRAAFALFTIAAIVFAWLSYAVGQFTAGWMKLVREPVPPFHIFRLPFHTVWIFLGAFGLLLLDYAPVYSLTLNVFAVAAFLYFCQGLAVVMYQMNRLGLGRIPRVVFWLLFVLTLVISVVILIMAGLFDSWFNFRRRPGDPDNITANNEDSTL